jgi:hypothetical protein
VWGIFGCAGVCEDRSVNLRTVATHSIDGDQVAALFNTERDSSLMKQANTSTPFDQTTHHPFTVRPDIPLLDALEHAATYLNCAEILAHQAPSAIRPEHSSSLRWASQQMLANARALIHASIAGQHAANARGDA